MSNDNKHPNETIINVDDINLSNVRSFDLPDGLFERAKRVHAILRDTHTMTFERFVDTFRADADPDGEMQVWEEIARIYQAFCDDNPNSSLKDKKEVFTDTLRESLSGGVVVIDNE